MDNPPRAVKKKKIPSPPPLPPPPAPYRSWHCAVWLFSHYPFKYLTVFLLENYGENEIYYTKLSLCVCECVCVDPHQQREPREDLSTGPSRRGRDRLTGIPDGRAIPSLLLYTFVAKRFKKKKMPVKREREKISSGAKIKGKKEDDARYRGAQHKSTRYSCCPSSKATT